MKWTREIVVTILIAILSLVISAYNGYTHNDKATEHRLSVVESNQQNDHENIKASMMCHGWSAPWVGNNADAYIRQLLQSIAGIDRIAGAMNEARQTLSGERSQGRPPTGAADSADAADRATRVEGV
jgi:hypothetical protein